MLKVWTYDRSDGDFVAAETAEEADSILQHELGYSANGEDAGHWFEIPGQEILTINLEDPCWGLPKGRHQRTAAEWCVIAGKGYLFSMNY
jgi:hypothetical protein